MQRLAHALALTAALLAGCTTTRYAQRPARIEEIAPLHTKARFHMTWLHVSPEGATSPVPTTLQMVPDADGESVPLGDLAGGLSNVRGYEIKRRGVGALEGLALGVVIGFIGGAVLGAAAGDDSKCDPDYPCVRFTSSDLAFLFGGIGAFGGSLVGPVIGSLVGHTDRTLFTDAPVGP
jgi:hypothetical protein